MIVPNFWAEAKARHRSPRKQITVRRYGWSMTGEDDARAMAEQRAAEALHRILSGETIQKAELKRAYNGSDGVPIREEVLARFGEEVITRNVYGAHCLNSPRALFADIDFGTDIGCRGILIVWALLAIPSVGMAIADGAFGEAAGALFVSLILAYPVALGLITLAVKARGGDERVAYRRIQRFVARHPDWNLRLYRSPAGYRLLATHRTFVSEDPEVSEFFTAIAADPIYVRMCINQKCFRARLTGKPWRMGIPGHMRPGVWPVRPERLALRSEWVDAYETRTRSFAACRFVESLGSGMTDSVLRSVVELHDRESHAQRTDLPLA